METTIYDLLPVEQKIIIKLKKEERSTYWLARKVGKSQGYVYALLFGNPTVKIKLTQQFLDAVNRVFPDCNFTMPES